MADTSNNHTPNNRSVTTEKFLRISDLSDKVGIGRSQIYKLIQQGDFPTQIKLGERISVWSESEIEEWMRRKVHLGRVTN